MGAVLANKIDKNIRYMKIPRWLKALFIIGAAKENARIALDTCYLGFQQPWLDQARSAAEIVLMKEIKNVFDPAGVLNPGKLLP